MPSAKGLGLDDRSGLPPVEPTAKPDHGDSGDLRRAPWPDVALLIERQWLAQKAIFCGESRAGTHAEAEAAEGVEDKRAQHGHALEEMAKLA
jgi:hypothetical protein